MLRCYVSQTLQRVRKRLLADEERRRSVCFGGITTAARAPEANRSLHAAIILRRRAGGSPSAAGSLARQGPGPVRHPC